MAHDESPGVLHTGPPVRILLRLTADGWQADLVMKSGAIANSAGVSPHLLGASPDEAKAFFEDVFEKTVPSAFGFRPEVLWRPGPDPDTWVGEIRAQAP